MPHLARPTSVDLDRFGGSGDVGTQKSGAGTCNFKLVTYGFGLRTGNCEVSTWKGEPGGRISEVATCRCEVGRFRFEPGTCSFPLGTCDCKVLSWSSRLQGRAAFLQNPRKYRQSLELRGVAFGSFLNSGHGKAEPYRNVLGQSRTALVA